MKQKTTKKKPSFLVRMFMDENDYTGFFGLHFPINEFVFDGFLYITLGAFGIASVDKYITNNKKNKESEGEEEITEG